MEELWRFWGRSATEEFFACYRVLGYGITNKRREGKGDPYANEVFNLRKFKLKYTGMVNCVDPKSQDVTK